MAQATFPKLSTTKIDLGQKLTITLNAESEDYTHKLTATIGSYTTIISQATKVSVRTWEVPLYYQNDAVYANSTSALVTIKCETFNGSTKIGENSVGFYATLPESIVPVISSVDVEDIYSEYAQGVAALEYKVNASTPNSTGVTYSYKFGSTISDSNVYDTDIIETSGNYEMEITVVDSRGRSASTTVSTTIYPYEKPTISLASYSRTNSTITLNITGFVYNDNRFTDPGNLKIYCGKYGESRSKIYDGACSGEFTLTQTISDADPDSAYVISLVLMVSVYGSEVRALATIPIDYDLIDFYNSGKGIAIGKEAEQEGLDVGLDAVFRGNVTFEGSTVFNDESSNLLVYPYNQTTRSANGCTITDNGDGTLTVDTNGGTTSGAATLTMFDNRSNTQPMLCEIGKNYTLSWNLTGTRSGIYLAVRFYDSNKSIIKTYAAYEDVPSVLVTAPSNAVYMSCWINVPANFSASDLIVKPMLESGGTAHDYQPFIPKGEVYCQAEKKIGRWLNGQEAYQKTFIITLDSTIGLRTVSLPLTEGATELVDIHQVVRFTSGNIASLPYVNSSYTPGNISTETIGIVGDSPSISVYTGMNRNNTKIYLTTRYLK